ncbi:chromosome segregation protein SMC [Arthrobacter echini]|uniref:Chromosome partition protein Smc n=1 Tax=Arthrobacter echini TaxID=1529066 RepID=A0A4S5E5Z7_9MICC|nr:chromosome segregation protein SMC [Arthrobacter echini]THJ66947.1 chromosome segregation protein SMC [Arthrobacter echini]
MHLKSLTVRGFKSFASATTFDFEPGITAVVGPNGSGKSNVVDALAWVMGEQGARSLRGARMEDVVFAGTSARAPLGRAQVVLTIDNSDGALPIDYTEVTISRTLFRTGGSEYAINGRACRLLDVQELLSDSGLGREMHVIVGQGQLDRVLHATPEERRGFIEEAAGILKHRRRREKTVRKLEAMQTNLARLSDLTAELRRQLTPLGKQAEVARRAQQVQLAFRDARSRLLADDLVSLREAHDREVAAEAELQAKRSTLEDQLAVGRERQRELEQDSAAAALHLEGARESWHGLSGARQKLAALAVRAEDRAYLLEQGESSPDRRTDPDRLDRHAAQARAEAGTLQEQVTANARALEDALVHRTEAEAAASQEDARLAGLLRSAADQREAMARLTGTVGAAQTRVDAAVADLARLRASISAAEEDQRTAERAFAALEGQVRVDEAGEAGLDAEYEKASAILTSIGAELESLLDQERRTDRERSSLAARLEVQREGLLQRDAAGTLLDAGLDGVLQPLSDVLQVAAGYERALAVALEEFSDAVIVESLPAALAALERVRRDDAGQVSLVIAPGHRAVQRGDIEPGTADRTAEAQEGVAGEGAVPLLSVVAAPPEVRAALESLLGGLVVVDDLPHGVRAVESGSARAAITRTGEVLSPHTARGGSAGAPAYLERRAAAEQTQAELTRAVTAAEDIRVRLGTVRGRHRSARQHVDEALGHLHDSDARMAALTEKLGQLNATRHSASGEKDRLDALLSTARSTHEREVTKLADAARALERLRERPVETEPSTQRQEELRQAAAEARQGEFEARLTLRSSEEQLSALKNRALSLERAAGDERRTQEQAARRARIRRAQALRAGAVARGARQAEEYAAASMAVAAENRTTMEQLRRDRDMQLQEIRRRNTDLGEDLARLTDAVHQDELARTQQRLRIEALEKRVLEELGLTPDHLVAEFGPHRPVPEDAVHEDRWAELRAPVDDAGHPVPTGRPFVRSEQEKRLRRAEKDRAALGKVNPLALEEFTALEERHQFLSTQLADLEDSRKDLLEIIREVDERVEQVFAAAYQDTAEQFERVFAALFPGGEGRLVLTDPEDMLSTGIEVEARPAGKRIRRLSLLSGGERSLTAVALLVAIFKARPSPFYVMDEVEAALDDTNLGRLIAILQDLSRTSQLIIITHQKRTMEMAHALYGVTMRGDGVSTVISQRLAAPAEY